MPNAELAILPNGYYQFNRQYLDLFCRVITDFLPIDSLTVGLTSPRRLPGMLGDFKRWSGSARLECMVTVNAPAPQPEAVTRSTIEQVEYHSKTAWSKNDLQTICTRCQCEKS